MNHKCQGDYVVNHRLYRCLGDSTFITDTDLPTDCPSCKRPVDATIHEKCRSYVKDQICIVIDGNEFVLREEIVSEVAGPRESGK